MVTPSVVEDPTDAMVGLSLGEGGVSPSKEQSSPLKDHAGQHPELPKMCIINADTMTRIIPNSEPFPIDNECFSGHVMMMIRTPEVDQVGANVPLGETPERISQYMHGKLRRFEFQFCVKLKKVPTGPLFLGCELEHPIKIGKVTKGLTGVLLAMIRRINSGFHYSWGEHGKKVDHEAISEGRYEKTHLSFPVEASMDRIVITKPGDTPPPLGYELYESPESVKRRRRMGAGSVDWNLDDTYTMCLWSAYCDWIQWRCLNVPGVRAFSLCCVTGTQPIYLSVYEVTGISNQDYKKKKPPHNRKDLAVYARFEFTNCLRTEGGLAQKVLGGKFERLETDTEFMDAVDGSLGGSDTASDSGYVSA